MTAAWSSTSSLPNVSVYPHGLCSVDTYILVLKWKRSGVDMAIVFFDFIFDTQTHTPCSAWPLCRVLLPFCLWGCPVPVGVVEQVDLDPSLSSSIFLCQSWVLTRTDGSLQYSLFSYRALQLRLFSSRPYYSAQSGAGGGAERSNLCTFATIRSPCRCRASLAQGSPFKIPPQFTSLSLHPSASQSYGCSFPLLSPSQRSDLILFPVF